MLLLLDNRDSFTFNLAQAFGALGAQVEVRPAASLSVRNVLTLNPDAICLGPGPGPPEEAQLSMRVIQRFSGHRPILGVCLGHQVLGSVYGLETVRASQPVHGRAVEIRHDGRGLFEGLPNPAKMARYNSLSVVAESVPDSLEVSATDGDGVVMGLRHKEHPTMSVQFHPESIVSEGGDVLFRNFLRIVERFPKAPLTAPTHG